MIDANIIVSFLIQAEETDRATEILRESSEDIKKDMKDDARTYMSNLRILIDKFNINIIHPPRDLEMISDIITKYRLMPNDAIIAATCQHYGIKCIATFDSDFKRVDFLKIVD